MTDFVSKQQFMSQEALSRPGRVVERRISDEVMQQALSVRKREPIEIEFVDRRE